MSLIPAINENCSIIINNVVLSFKGFILNKELTKIKELTKKMN